MLHSVVLQLPYCPLLPIGAQQKTLQRMVCASWKVCFLCCPSCLSHSLLMVSFVSRRMHMAESPTLNRYDFFSPPLFHRDPHLQNHPLKRFLNSILLFYRLQAIFASSGFVMYHHFAASHEATSARELFQTSLHITVTQLDFH